MIELIEEAKSLLSGFSGVSKATACAYERDVRRLLSDTATVSSVASHYRLRAAWVWWNRSRLLGLLVELESVVGDGRQAILEGIRHSIEALRACPALGAVSDRADASQSGSSEGRDRRLKRAALSKRRGTARLPSGWRQQFLRGLGRLDDREFNALVFLALTGCRPAELAGGLIVAVNPRRNAIAVEVHGAKVTSLNGQPVRHLAFALDQELAGFLRLPQAEARYSMRVSLAISRLDYLMAAGNQAAEARFRTRVSAISFRHQFSADLKSAGYSQVEIAEALGHRSIRTQQFYGRASHGGAGRPVIAIRATHAVREHQERNLVHQKFGSGHIVQVNKRITEKSHG